MATTEVEVVTGWHGGPFGSKEPGDKFDYDYDRDPVQLKKLGLVKKVPGSESRAGEAKKPAA